VGVRTNVLFANTLLVIRILVSSEHGVMAFAGF